MTKHKAERRDETEPEGTLKPERVQRQRPEGGTLKPERVQKSGQAGRYGSEPSSGPAVARPADSPAS